MKNRIPILFFLTFLLLSGKVPGQVSGVIREAERGTPLAGVEVYAEPSNAIAVTDRKGRFEFRKLKPGSYRLISFSEDFASHKQVIELGDVPVKLTWTLKRLEVNLDAVEIVEDASKDDYGLLCSIEGTAIYASKKNEVIRPGLMAANLSTNNSRQIYAKVAGLNIWESDGAGLQLGIGGRGLSPNRTSNFNTRQNGYDISADALGYPETYYTPPTEAVERIEVVRGAAALQYGTQFGGMLNFIMKSGPQDKPVQVTARQTLGSFGLYNAFTSIGGTVGRFSYYGFYQYKRGNGWRENSGFENHTAYGGFQYRATANLRLGLELTHLEYVAQQAGGLTDVLFEQDPRQSIRDRNWFKINWNLAAFKLDYKPGKRTHIDSRTFGLLAERHALGFLGVISRIDPLEERDYIRGYFRNLGHESRLIHKYSLRENPSAILVGFRAYRGRTRNTQGFANDGDGPDFQYLNADEPGNSDYTFPSQNIAVFAENFFQLSPKFSVTPGIRYEYIRTASDGYFYQRTYNLAGDLLFEQKTDDEKDRSRDLVLAGVGLSYKPMQGLELYGNFSQNYRAINFNDLRVVNPNFRIDENLKDERGFNADLGFRGSYKKFLRWDVSLFYLQYRDRIGLRLAVDSVLFNLYRFRTNIADSRNLGFESLVELDVWKAFAGPESPTSLTLFSNFAMIHARYVNSDDPAIQDRFVELVPPVTLKTGLSFRHKGFMATAQYAYTHEHFTDATNAERTSTAVNGIIPSYSVMDLSLSYQWKFLKVEAGANNVLDARYFTRRAAGYPGPGIIPADGRSFYGTLQVQL